MVPLSAEDAISTYRLTERHWVEKGLAGTPFFAWVYLDCGTRPLSEYNGECHSITLTFFEHDYTRYYYDRASMISLRNAFIARVDADPSFLDRFEAAWQALLNQLETAMGRLDQTDLSSLSNEDLYGLYNDYYETYVAEYSPALIYPDSFSMDAHNFLTPIFEKALPPEHFLEYYPALFAPVTESFVTSEHKHLLNIMANAQDQGLQNESDILSTFSDQLTQHSQHFFWVRNNYAKVQILTAADFAAQISSDIQKGVDAATELQKFEAHLPKAIARKRELIAQLKLEPYLLNLIRIAERFTYIQDERKKCVLRSCHYLQRFLSEFSRRTGFPEAELRQAIHPEIKDILLQRNADHRRLSARTMHCACINTPSGYSVIEGEAAAQLYRELFKPHTQVDEFKGMCASRGKARGPVRIVLTPKDLGAMQKGDILVTSMTRPDMVVAVKKAAAIVTDEGGITSHAAIVSREMGVPCILATQVATKILRNGDIIEIDADAGIVTIVSRVKP